MHHYYQAHLFIWSNCQPRQINKLIFNSYQNSDSFGFCPLVLDWILILDRYWLERCLPRGADKSEQLSICPPRLAVSAWNFILCFSRLTLEISPDFFPDSRLFGHIGILLHRVYVPVTYLLRILALTMPSPIRSRARSRDSHRRRSRSRSPHGYSRRSDRSSPSHRTVSRSSSGLSRQLDETTVADIVDRRLDRHLEPLRTSLQALRADMR